MNLLSLPNEMIASVFKYMDYDFIRLLRKMNSRVNTVCKTVDLGVRIPVDTIECCEEKKSWYFTVLKKQSVTSANHQFLYSKDCQFSFLEALNYVLQKTTKIDFFVMAYCEQPVNDEVLFLFLKYKKSFRQMTYLRIHASFTCSTEKLNNFNRSLLSLKKIYLEGNQLNVIIKSDIFRRRKFDSVTLLISKGHNSDQSDYNHDGLTDKFLYDTQHSCKHFHFHYVHSNELKLTVPAIVKVFKIALANGIGQSWKIKGVRLDERAQFEGYKLLSSIPNSTINSPRPNEWTVICDLSMNVKEKPCLTIKYELANEWNL